MNRSGAIEKKEVFLLFSVLAVFVLAMLLESANGILFGLYLVLLAVLALPLLPWLRNWWVPLTIGFIILMPGPLDRTFLPVKLTPEEGSNPVAIFSVIDLLMLLTLAIKFKSEHNLKSMLNARMNFLTVSLMFITILAIFSSVMSYINFHSFYLPMAFRATFYSIRFLLVFAWISNFFDDLKVIKKLPFAIGLISLGFLLLVILSPAEDPDGENRLSVATYGLNTFGHLLTFTSLLCIPFLLYYLKERNIRLSVLVIACFITCLTFLLMSANRMSFGLLLLGIGIFSVLMPAPFKKKLKIGLVLMLVLSVTVFLFSMLKPDLFNRVFGIFQLLSGETTFDDIKELQSRLVVWSLSVEMITEHPFFGVGPGQWNYLKTIFGSMPDWMTSILDPHNGYLLYASEMGLICMLIYYSIIFYSIRRGFRAFRLLKKYYAVNSLKDVSLYMSFILVLNIVVICWLLSDLTNASGLNIRVQSLMWSLCSILFISPSLSRKFIERNYEN